LRDCGCYFRPLLCVQVQACAKHRNIHMVVFSVLRRIYVDTAGHPAVSFIIRALSRGVSSRVASVIVQQLTLCLYRLISAVILILTAVGSRHYLQIEFNDYCESGISSNDKMPCRTAGMGHCSPRHPRQQGYSHAAQYDSCL
jgi:hypothetical protein